MTHQPLGDKILLRPLVQAEAKTDAGIILSENQEPYHRGVVVAVSETVDTPLSPGQSVLYEKQAGTPLLQNGEPHLLLSEQHIIAIEAKVTVDSITTMAQVLNGMLVATGHQPLLLEIDLDKFDAVEN